MTISDKLYAILIQGGSWKTILGGLWVTVQIFVLALVLGTVLGAVICLMRTRKNPVLRGIASVYIAVLRGTPVLTELLRSALSASDRGQAEAARTLGFSAWDTFRLITLPQVLRIAKPVYQSTIVNLIQWTSVVGYVTITDLTRVINNTASRTMQPLLTIIIGMLIYLAMAYIVFGVFALTDRAERRKRGEAA